MKCRAPLFFFNAVALGAASLSLATPALAVPQVRVANTTVNARECSNQVKVNFQLSEAAAGPVTIRYTTKNGSAKFGSDFAAKTGSVQVPAGKKAVAVPFRILDNSAIEPLENFLVQITSVSGSGATLAPSPGNRTKVQIQDDEIPAGALVGTLGTGTSQPSAVEGAETFSTIDFLLPTADYDNSVDLDLALDENGRPTCTPTALRRGNFTRPATWPPASATGSTAFPVPATIVNTSFSGAFDPAQSRSQHWDQRWTVGVNGNQDVWKFFGGSAAPGTALSGKSAPVANGTCPSGTTLRGTFSARVGSLANDETFPKLFTGGAASGDYDVCRLPREIAGNLLLTNDNVYELQDGFPGTYVGNGYRARNQVANPTAVKLTIQPGTLIFGQPQEALIVSRKSRIVANGTAAAPIVMTSLKQLQQRFDANLSTPVDSDSGEWAGVAILGYGRDNKCANAAFATCDLPLEGNVGFYGGNSDNDNSGSLRYVVIRHAGNDIDGSGNELNGLTMGGVGRGTTVDYVQVHKGFDDGIEFFGGNSFVSHVVVSSTFDDSIDYDNGWTGGAQFVYIVQADSESPGLGRGIEAGSSPGNAAAPFESFALLSNFTIVGPANRASGGSIDDGQAIVFRGGVRTQLWNSVATGDQSKGCLDIDDALTFDRSLEQGGTLDAPGSNLFIRNSVFDCTTISTVEND